MKSATTTKSGPDEFLYVPGEEIAEAIALGARRVDGDARLSMPRPLPDGVLEKSFDRWRTQEARYAWCMHYVARILNEGIVLPDFDELMTTLGRGIASYERVYLYVPTFDADEVRQVPDVYWDRRRRMFYAGSSADMNLLYRWLTPAARSIWETEQIYARALTLLVQESARGAVAPPSGSGGIVTEIEGGREDSGHTSSSLLDMAESQDVLRRAGRTSYTGS